MNSGQEPNADSAAQYLDELFAEHRNARDLCEGLYEELGRLLKRNRNAGLPAIREQLLDWVATMDGSRWDISLEALRRDPDPRNAVDITAVLREGREDREWRESLVLALLRLRHVDGLDLYRAHIAQQLDHPQPATLTLLQHLYALDLESALDWSALVFARLYVHGKHLGMTYPGHLIALSSASPEAVPNLVRKTALVRRAAGEDLRRHFLAELQKQWVRAQTGESIADDLNRSLTSASLRNELQGTNRGASHIFTKM